MKPVGWVVLGTTAMCAAPVWAQSAPKPAIKTESNKPAAPVPGKNSFTAGEARSRMEKAGFKVTSDPVKDADGIWHADASKAGTALQKLMMDYQGNVFVSNKPEKPLSGETKLTSDQARTLMEKRGYNVTSIPIKDDQGIWYAEGRLTENNPVQVMVDHEGNVFESAQYFGHPTSAPGAPPMPHNPITNAPAQQTPVKK